MDITDLYVYVDSIFISMYYVLHGDRPIDLSKYRMGGRGRGCPHFPVTKFQKIEDARKHVSLYRYPHFTNRIFNEKWTLLETYLGGILKTKNDQPPAQEKHETNYHGESKQLIFNNVPFIAPFFVVVNYESDPPITTSFVIYSKTIEDARKIVKRRINMCRWGKGFDDTRLEIYDDKITLIETYVRGTLE